MSEFLIELSSQKDWNDPNYNNLTQPILLSTELLLSSKLFRKIISIQKHPQVQASSCLICGIVRAIVSCFPKKVRNNRKAQSRFN